MTERDAEFRRAITVHEMDRVRSLLAEGVDVNSVNDQGMTPLMVAAGAQSPLIVQLLLEAGADPRPINGYGYTAEMVAEWHGEVRMMSYTEASTQIQEMLREACRRFDGTSPL